MQNKNIQRHIWRSCCLVLGIILLLTNMPVLAASRENADNVIRVGSFEEIYNTVNEKGERSGYGYEYLQGIAGYAGWSYEYVDSNWDKCFDELEKGNIDILGGISYTEERAEKMLFSDMPMGQERYFIYTNAANSNLSASDISSFKDKRIGVLKDHLPEKVLNVWEKKNGVILEHINISSTDEIMDKLMNNEIDCFVSVESSIWAELSAYPVTGIGESDIFFAVRKDRPDIKEALDSAMRRIKDDNPFYTDDLYKRYLSAPCSALLSEKEREWLAEHGAIKIGYLNNDTGVSMVDPKTGELTGVITDYVKLAKNSLQGQTLEFDLKGYDSREEQLKALQEGKIDIIFHVSQNPYFAEKNGFVLSDTVWSFNMAAITSKNSFDESDKNVVAILKDNLALKAYVSYNYPQWTIKEFETRADATKAMQSGEADCCLSNSGSVSSFLKSKKYHAYFLTKSADASFAIYRGEPVLLSIMNKTLMSMSTSKLSGAVISYSNAQRRVTVTDFLQDNMMVFLVSTLMIFSAVCGLWHKSIRSGRRAKKLNTELHIQKTQLEKAFNEAKLQGEIIGSIGKIYSFIYRIDLRDETFEEVSSDKIIQRVAGAGGAFNETKADVINAMVAEEYREIIDSFLELSTIPERMKDIDSISIEYRTPQNTWQMAQLIVKNRDINGEVTEVLYAVRQIDRQKQIENQYKQKLLFNSRVLSGLSTDYTIAFVLDLDTDLYEIAFNQSTNHAKQVSSIKTFSEYVDRYVESFVLPEFKGPMKEALNSESIKRRFAAEGDYHFSFETTPNAAGLSCFQVHIVRQYDEGGHFAFLGFRSVDEAIRQERSYKQQLQNQLELITAALPGGVKISNDDDTYSFKYVSEQFAQMLGYTSPEDLMNACGGSIVGLAHPDDLATGIADALDQYSKSNHYATNYRMRCKDGSYKYIEDRGQKVISPDGTVEHWNLILDKNDLMEKSIALESEKKANQSKSSFLARMSHDMRTPLNGILGLIKINMDHFDDTALVQENYRKMQISADHLLSLINDVLQMSKIEDGTVPLTHELIDINELTRNIVVMVEQRAAENDISLQLNAKKDYLKNPYIYGSPLHLRQIFLNIYSNCIKYNHKGGSISTVADYTEEENGIVFYEWVISDTGIGMSREFLEHIFEPFVQEKDDARSVYQGIGLGMAIVKGLVERMGGTIQVESKEGVGSSFTIRIPFEVAEPPKESENETEKADENIQGFKLLLVEDNELNAEIAKTLLEDAGAEVTVAGDGEKAFDTFKNNAPGTFDAVLMDIMMPVMNGYEATRAIRGFERADAKTIPIIAMTANAFAEDAKKCLQAGMNAHLPKPLDMDKVKKTLCIFVKHS